MSAIAFATDRQPVISVASVGHMEEGTNEKLEYPTHRYLGHKKRDELKSLIVRYCIPGTLFSLVV